MTGGQPTQLDHLSAVMSRVARRLQEEHGNVDATLQAITAAAVAVVPDVEGCSISYVIGRSKVEPRASTSDLSRDLDRLQQQLQQGPCLDAVWREQVVRVDDMSTEDRWPTYAREASARGVGSMMSLQLFVEEGRLGAMNLYSPTVNGFDDDAQEMGLMVASHAAIALSGAQSEHNLRLAMNSRDVIGQAKGILMERYKLTADQAFGVLAHASQEANRKLLDVAQELADTGAMHQRRTPLS